VSFVSLPFWAVLAGAVALAALLFVLQILKARQKRVRIAAAGLWAHAARVAPLRVFRQKFLRWLAYLLILAIALLMWAAGARPEMTADRDAAHHVFYLDASVGLTGRDDFQRARRALIADVRATEPSRRAVYLGDATGTPLLRPGENIALLTRRLDGRRAQAFPSGFAHFVAAGPVDPMVARSPGKRIIIHYYGAWPSGAAARPTAGTEVVWGYLAEPIANNRGIVALGARPAASGAADRADILVQAVDARGAALSAEALRFSRDGRDMSVQTTVLTGGALMVRDVRADGSLITVRLTRGDDFPADDRAALRLPSRGVLKVALSIGAPLALREVVRLDAGLIEVPADQADVVVRRDGERFGASRPALVLTGTAGPAFRLTYADSEDAPDLAADAESLGLSDLDAASIAQRTNRVIGVEAGAGPRRGLSVWAVLFEEGRGFTASADFPVFVSRSLWWLSDPRPWIPYAAAGTALVDQSDLYGLTADRRIAARALNGDLYVGAAGEIRIGDLSTTVSLLDRTATLDAALPRPAEVVVAAVRGPAVDLLFTLLVLLAGLLLLLEWRLHQRGVLA
jgi:hypothetical protein